MIAQVQVPLGKRDLLGAYWFPGLGRARIAVVGAAPVVFIGSSYQFA
jgi:hypothetical protein